MITKTTNQLRLLATMLLALFAIGTYATETQQTTVASWVFSEGWDAESSGSVITYTPDGSGGSSWRTPHGKPSNRCFCQTPAQECKKTTS